MQSTLAILFTTLLATAQAGNICVAGEYKASKYHVATVNVFAAGKPCDDGLTTKVGASVTSLCDNLPQGVRICGENANLVKIDHGPKSASGCQVGLEINGQVYEGTTYGYNPDDANQHKGPCDASCGFLSTTGLDGYLQFIGVPMCDNL